MKTNIVFVLLLLSIVSCRTTRNLKKSDIKTDSTQVVRKDSVAIKEENTTEQSATKLTVIKEETKDRTTTTTVEEFKLPDSLKESTIIRRTTVVDINKGKKKTERTKTDTLQKKTIKTDSAYKNTSDSTRLIQDAKVKNVDTVKTSGGGWINAGLMLLVVVILAGFGYWLYRKNKIMKLFIFLLLMSANCFGQSIIYKWNFYGINLNGDTIYYRLLDKPCPPHCNNPGCLVATFCGWDTVFNRSQFDEPDINTSEFDRILKRIKEQETCSHKWVELHQDTVEHNPYSPFNKLFIVDGMDGYFEKSTPLICLICHQEKRKVIHYKSNKHDPTTR